MSLDLLQSFLRHPGEERPEPAPDDTADIPVITPDTPAPVAGGHVTYGRQAMEALTYAVRQGRRRWREEQSRQGSHIARARAASWSIDDTIRYAGDRPWVPPGHDGGIAEMAGRAYFLLIGIPGVSYAAWLRWKFDRPLRWLIWTALRFAALMAILTWLGHGKAAAWITGVVLGLAVTAAAVLMPRRSHVGEDPAGDTEEEEDTR